MSEDSKQKAWLEHYQRLLNVEFDWDPDHLSYQPPVEGQPIPITIDMVKKAISQMKAGKAPGPSGVVVEMIRAAGDMGPSMICDLAAAIIRDGWEQFHCLLLQGKGGCIGKEQLLRSQADRAGQEVLERIVDGHIRQLVSIDDSQFGFGPNRGTTDAIFVVRQLQEKYLAANKRLLQEVLERIVDGHIRQLVSIDDSQFGFGPNRGTTDAIFVVRQLQEKYLAANKRLYMASVDLEKAFDQVPRKVIWWPLRKLGVAEWIVRLVQGMYANGRSRVRVRRGTVKSSK